MNDSAVASMRRNAERQGAAIEIAPQEYETDDVEVFEDAGVEWCDGGYWVEARVWVDAEDVEEFCGF